MVEINILTRSLFSSNSSQCYSKALFYKMFLYGCLYNYALFLKVSHNDLRMCIFQSSLSHLSVSLHPGICIYLSWVFFFFFLMLQNFGAGGDVIPTLQT